MKTFRFNHTNAILTITISIAFNLLGSILIMEGLQFESKVLIDTTGVLLIITGSLMLVYGFVETRLVWLAISIPPTKVSIEKDHLEIFDKKSKTIVNYSKIKKVTFFERETFTRRSISNDIEYMKIETYDQGSYILTSFIVQPRRLEKLLKIPSSKKTNTDRKPFQRIC